MHCVSVVYVTTHVHLTMHAFPYHQLLHDQNTSRSEDPSVEPEIHTLYNKTYKDYRKVRHVKILLVLNFSLERFILGCDRGVIAL